MGRNLDPYKPPSGVHPAEEEGTSLPELLKDKS